MAAMVVVKSGVWLGKFGPENVLQCCHVKTLDILTISKLLGTPIFCQTQCCTKSKEAALHEKRPKGKEAEQVSATEKRQNKGKADTRSENCHS